MLTVITYILTYTVSYFYAKKCFYASFNKFIVIPVAIALIAINIVFYYADLNIISAITLKLFAIGLLVVFFWYKYKNELKTILGRN